MRIIKRKALLDFWQLHPDAQDALEAWYYEAKRSEWKTPSQIKALYASASILKKQRVVFNICGNKYRLVTLIKYTAGIILIRFIGTHREYDKINAEEI